MTSHIRGTVTSVALALLVVSCASGLSKDECKVADWRGIGFEDGALGLPESRVAAHRKACAEHGVALDLDDYRDGWEEGVRRYCQPGNGYRQGRSGNSYAGVCPADVESDFLQAYGQGRELYGLESEIRHTARALRYKRNRLEQIELALRDTGIEIVSPDVPVERRLTLWDEMRRLENERAETKAAIPELEDELARRREQLAELSETSAY